MRLRLNVLADLVLSKRIAIEHQTPEGFIRQFGWDCMIVAVLLSRLARSFGHSPFPLSKLLTHRIASARGLTVWPGA